ncbi:acyl-CoA dehydrogenase family protein [Myceligenerans crystallogenes]
MTDTGHPLAPPAHERPLLDAALDLAAGFAGTAAALDESAAIPLDNLRALHAAGLDAATLPESLGGQGLSYRAYGEIVRAVAAAEPSTACIWVMHIGAAGALAALSPEPEAARFAEALRSGSRFANALSEPAGGNLFLLPQQEAVADDDGWRLSGTKRFVSGCEIADHLLVNALVDGVPTFFGVDPDDTIGYVPIWDTMGMRATRSQLVSFDGTLLRGDRRCAPPEPDQPNHVSAGLAFLSIGIAEAALAALVAHARGRVVPTTGEPLARMQWVQHAVADAAVRLDAARLSARHSVWLADQRSPGFIPATLNAKLLAGEVAKDIAQLGVSVGGGSGYLRTSPIQRHFRDAQAGALMAYSAEVCRTYIGSALLEDAPDEP